MSVDIAGPFQPGLDQVFGASPRYFMVANVAIPVDAEGPMVKGLRIWGFGFVHEIHRMPIKRKLRWSVPKEKVPWQLK